MPVSNKHLEKAEHFLQKGKLDAALAEFLVAWKEQPDNDAVVQTVADLYSRQNKLKECRQCYAYLCDKSVERNDGPKALEVFRKLQKLGPVEPKRLLACAQFLEKQKPQEAAAQYRQALEAVGGQDREVSLRCLQGLSKLQPASLEVQQQTATLALQLGNSALASSAYQRVGELLSREGKYAEATEVLEQAYRLSGNSPSAQLSLAQACLKAGNSRRVLELIGKAEEEPDDSPLLSVLAEACRAEKQLERAETAYWKLLKISPETYDSLLEIALEYLRQEQIPLGLRLLNNLQQDLLARKRQKELAAFAEKLSRISHANIAVLEFSCRLLDQPHYDSPLFKSLNNLFDLYFAAGEFHKATDTLQRLVDLDPYDLECTAKLQRLEGKAETAVWNELAIRLGKTPASADTSASSATGPAVAVGAPAAQAENGEGGNVLADLIVQAEIFLQYKLEAKARERLERIAKLFPHEEEKDKKLIKLYKQIRFTPKYADLPPRPAPAEPAEIRVDWNRVSEISRNLSRQGTVKGVLFAAVNDIGRLWQMSRCVVGLVTPNRPPSMVLEYISPGISPSKAGSLGKLVMGLQQITQNQNAPLAAENVSEVPQLAALQSVLAASQVQSLAAIPLRDGDQPTGILVLEQCGDHRHWGGNDLAGLEAIAEQLVLAVSNARLRSLMKTLAVTDESSGLLHRDSYLTCLLSEAERMRTQKSSLAGAILQFSIASQLPHEHREQALDKFLKEYASTLASHLRQNDIGVQYSKDTLAIIMPCTTGKDAVLAVEKLRRLVASIPLPHADGPAHMAGGIG